MQVSALTFSLIATAACAVAIVLALVDQRREPEPGHGWFVAALVAFLAAAIPFHPFGFDYEALDNPYPWRFAIVLVVLLPVLLLHVVSVVSNAAPRRAMLANDAVAAVLAVWILAMPAMPGTDVDPAPWWFQAAFATFAAQFVVCVALSVYMLRRAARVGVGPARTRANLLAGAIVTFAVGYLLWFAWPDPTIEFVSSLVAFAAGSLLWLAVRAPRRMYVLLPRSTTEGPGDAIARLAGRTDVTEALPDALEVVSHAWGLVGAAVLDGTGAVLAIHGSSPLGTPAVRVERMVTVEPKPGDVAVIGWTVPLTPPIRRVDRQQLAVLATLIQLSLEREAAAQVGRRALDESEAAARTLAVATQRLSQADDITDRFVSVVANELRGPIATLLGLTRRSDTEWGELPPDQLVPLQGLLARQAERLASIVEQLLLVSSIDDGALRSERAPTMLHDLLRSAVRDAGLEEHEVHVELPAHATLELEPVPARRIVSILLENARRHGDHPIELRAGDQDGEVHLEVIDHGSGVDPAFVPRLFERFARDARPGEPGIGLGLAIAQELAASLHGRVTYSRRDDTTVFALHLPA